MTEPLGDLIISGPTSLDEFVAGELEVYSQALEDDNASKKLTQSQRETIERRIHDFEVAKSALRPEFNNPKPAMDLLNKTIDQLKVTVGNRKIDPAESEILSIKLTTYEMLKDDLVSSSG